jgi:hypothetical protein
MPKFTISGYSYQTIEGTPNILFLHINEKINYLPFQFYGTVFWENGTKSYYQNSELHRDNDLPAVEHGSGTKLYYKNGVEYVPNNK